MVVPPTRQVILLADTLDGVVPFGIPVVGDAVVVPAEFHEHNVDLAEDTAAGLLVVVPAPAVVAVGSGGAVVFEAGVQAVEHVAEVAPRDLQLAEVVAAPALHGVRGV